mgnify:FL=1
MADVNCEKEWQNRPPAKFTLEKLKEQDKLNRELENKDNLFDKTIALMQKDVSDINEKLDCLGAKMDKFIDSADDKYADKEQFIFWRWVLIAGVILSAVIGIWFKK